MENRRRRGIRERGAVVVETALLLPLLLLIIFGIIDLGRAFNTKQALTHATREAVRVYAVTQDNGTASNAFWTGATGLDAARITVSIPADDSCTPGDPVSVTSSYDFNFIALPFTSISIDSTGVMRCGG
jgi:Flp pilus assembly protein TadG